MRGSLEKQPREAARQTAWIGKTTTATLVRQPWKEKHGIKPKGRTVWTESLDRQHRQTAWTNSLKQQAA